MPQTSTSRFSNRVADYAKYRPGYPPELFELLRRECGLFRHTYIADVGSGTGILARYFAEAGNIVLGIEPNAEMRAFAERDLKKFKTFTSIDGTAEATTLPDTSVDMITAAQAAHWFDFAKSRAEFVRILKPGGWVVLVWNERELDTTPFLRDYEKLLLDFGTDYEKVRHERTTDRVTEFFGPAKFRSAVFPNRQLFDFEGLRGRLLSSSYTPPSGDARHEPMLAELRRIFDAHSVDGRVSFDYQTRVYWSQLR
jgi:SAM-dependent methyltransferase